MKPRFARVRRTHIQATTTPCVFCGADDNQAFIHGVIHPDGVPFEPSFHVACKQCRASGPVAKSAEEAIKAWGHIAAVRLEDEPPALLGGTELDDEEMEFA